jgi:hypothetical protein
MSSTTQFPFNLIPRDKHDIETALKLKQYSYHELKPIVPNLLEWIQDMNWPVAGPVSDYLQTISSYITPQIIQVLRVNDPQWKYWCLIVFGKQKPIDPLLLQEIKLLAERITKMEIEEGVLEEAQQILIENCGNENESV